MRFLNLYIFLLITSHAFSQNSLTDKQYREFQSKARININGNIDSSFYYANKIEKSSNLLHKTFAKGIKSYLFQLKGDTIQSNLNYNYALKELNNLNKSTEKTKTEAFIYLYKGLTNWKRRKFSSALEMFNKGKALTKKLNDIELTIKFNNNIALVYADIENYRDAINITKKSENEIEKNKFQYSFDEYNNTKSNIYFNLGKYYEKIITKDKYIDSAVFYYKKSILYSNNLIDNKLSSQINIANIYVNQDRKIEAKKIYYNVFKYAKEKKINNKLIDVSNNIALMNYYDSNYDEALIHFKIVDSVYKINPTDKLVYLFSNFYQAKIFKTKNDSKSAIKHSEIYLEEYENYYSNLLDETLKINFVERNKELNNEISEIVKNEKKNVFKKNILIVLVIIIFIVITFFLLKNIRDKKIARKKVEILIEEFNSKSKEKSNLKQENYSSSSINIDDEKEKEILTKLKNLIEKKYYLSSEFNQQNVAKKIKTNTTYLSSVVNKYFEKSFSEYSNELKINYVIEQMINNKNYRKYSTQAIAESVGFKSAISFSKSFKKRTGLTPAQFSNNIKD